MSCALVGFRFAHALVHPVQLEGKSPSGCTMTADPVSSSEEVSEFLEESEWEEESEEESEEEESERLSTPSPSAPEEGPWGEGRGEEGDAEGKTSLAPFMKI